MSRLPLRRCALFAVALALASALSVDARADITSVLAPKPTASATADKPKSNAADHPDEDAGEEPEAPDSPRASMAQFLTLTRAGNYAGAAAFIDVPKERAAGAPELARRLIAVLDRYDWIDLDKLSPQATGFIDDGLPRNYESLGTVPGANNTPEPVRLVRQNGKSVRWVFTRTTVDKVDGWYEDLPDRWFSEHLPSALLRPGPRGLLRWQWIALPLVFVAVLTLGALAGWLLRKAFAPIVKRTPTPWDDAILKRLAGPLALALAIAFAYVAVPTLALYEPARVFVQQVLHGAVLFDFFWTLSRIMDVGARMLVDADWARQRRGSLALVSLVARVGKVVVVAFAVVAFLSELGYPVASVIAGLGVGGLAIALAAQKTVENLFGAFSIGADQPFREGDFIKVEDVSGTVETIGLRSTRIRTLDRTLVTMPNGKLADARIESFTARDRIRFTGTVALPRTTPAAALERILAGAKRVMHDHAKVWPDGIVARLAEIREASLAMELTCWFQTSNFSEFEVIRQDVLLAVMHIIEDASAPAKPATSDDRTADPVPPSGNRPQQTPPKDTRAVR